MAQSLMMRGLTNYITELRASKNREDEEARVDKELGNIRAKFTAARLSEYDRRKYVWKMMYTSMLGYEVDFGLSEVLNLIQFPGFKDKCVGYTAATVLMSAASDTMPAMLRAMRGDIAAADPMLQCLALTASANFGGSKIADDIGDTVRSVLFGAMVPTAVRKKAALVLLRLFRVKPSLLPVPDYTSRLIDMLELPTLGEKQAVLCLILGVLAKNGVEHFAPLLPRLITMLNAVAVDSHADPHYVYHKVACPWYRVRILRALRHFPFPTDKTVQVPLTDVLTDVLRGTPVTKSLNHNNASHAILFEAINIVIRYGTNGPASLRERAVEHLSQYVNIREPNVRYLGLEGLTRMASLPGTREQVLRQQKAILISLKERDISLRRRALDLLFATCGRDNAEEIVGELVTHLITADSAIRSEMVLKIAILAERFAPNLRWYVDVVLKLLAHAGDHVSDDIWHRAVQIVTNNPPLQRYAAVKMFQAVETSMAHETAVKVAAYILGEFGFLLQEPAAGESATGDADDATTVSGSKQFVALHQHFDRVAPESRVLLLSAYAKLQHLYEAELDHVLTPIFEAHTTVLNEELQQRAVEYLSLKAQSDDLKGRVLEAMPAFEERESVLEARLKDTSKTAKDVDEWGKEADGAAVAADSPAASAPTPGRAKRAKGGAVGPDDESSSSGNEAEPAAQEDEDILGLGGDDAGFMGGADDAFGAAAAGDSPNIVASRGVPSGSLGAVRTALFSFLDRGRTRAGLFADDTVQLGAVVEFRGALGRLRLHIVNKSDGDLRNIEIDCPGTDAVATSIVDVPDRVPAGERPALEIRFKCMRPFADLIPITVSFHSGPMSATVEHSYALRAPVFTTSFLEAVALPMDALKARWGALAGEPKAARATVPVLRDPAAVLRAIGAEVVQASPEHGALGAATFRTEATNPDGKKISVGCLFKVSPQGSETAIEVRSQHGLVTRGLVNSIKAAFAHGVGSA
ncbi:hypothetical protein FNF27_01169 [Cafeteria roenbergensis]|uniref:AP-2 complex subunit alpha n=1 Tax=Cafeteria roenbergensis TaxID=33653 RepID=A0A5A8ENT3_CAFRO|nr:hypothetical protein FNF27_01169 [Cafeteria roenbergensis]